MEPLRGMPDDEIDAYLDETFMFFDTEWDDNLTKFSARYADGSCSTHLGMLFSIKDDTPWEYENSQGYCTWHGRTAFDEELMAKYDGAHEKDSGIPYEFTGVVG